MSSERQQGFTLLEILLAVLIFGWLMTALLDGHTQSISQLIRANTETTASRLAEEKLRQIRSDALSIEFPDVGKQTGDFGEENEELFLRWELDVEVYGVALPEDLQEWSDSSSVFEPAKTAQDPEPPSLRLLTLRVFDTLTETEVIDPFTTFIVEPPTGVDVDSLQ